MDVNGGAQHNDSEDVQPTQQGLSGSCQLAVKVDGKLEQLGEAYNELEEQLYKLECADQSRGETFKKFAERLRLLEAWKAEALEDPSKAKDAARGREIDAFDPKTLEEQLSIQQSTLSQITQRLEQLEAREPKSTPATLQSTHDLAQSLIQRLTNGDVLNSSDASQLKVLLYQKGMSSSHDLPKQLSTPALTDSTTRQSTTEIEGQPLKRKRGRPRLSSRGRNSGDEQPSKKPRGRPPLRASEGSGIRRSTEKWPPGRPPKHDASILQAVNDSKKTALDTSHINTGTIIVSEKTELGDASDIDSEVAQASKSTASLSAAFEDNPVDTIQDPEVSNTSDASPETEKQIDIPPERRSERAAKPTKPFGDVMSWKEANLHMQHLKPHPPPSKPTG